MSGPPTVDQHAALAATWSERPGLMGWLSSVDHKTIGRRFLVTSFMFFAAGGVLAVIMRLQLARPGGTIVGPDVYNQVFTVHGTTMMFLFAVPAMLSMAIYLVPLMVGARSIAFPRLVAFGYYMFLFGGLFLFVSLIVNTGPDNGWFSYVPLAESRYSPTKRADVWAQFITFSELATLVVAVSIATTILKLRTPGMSLDRMPLFVWAMLIVSIMIMFAMPAVMLASTELILDRLVQTRIFQPPEGGDALLWQHLFWFFGHPEVYIIFLPAQGMMSMLLSTFTGRRIVGYLALVLVMTSTAFLGFSVWAHHMFAAGIPQFGASLFTVASIMIALPTGVQIFCWIATIWSGRLVIRTPALYMLAFFVVFLIGGMTGVMLAVIPFDRQVHDTFFVVAHFHYVLIGGAVFPLLGAVHYWFPKFTGRMLSERIGTVAFVLFFIGFNTAFFPQHILGLYGMPRRVYSYAAETGWGPLNLLSTGGAAVMALGIAVYFFNVLTSLKSGTVASDNPWQAPTLEWATSSPPPPYNFDPIPTVASLYPLWDADPASAPVIVGLRTDEREVLVTHVLDAELDHRYQMPDPSIWPFITAITVTVMFIWSIFSAWGAVYGSIPIVLALTAWTWPRHGMPPAQADHVMRPAVTSREALS